MPVPARPRPTAAPPRPPAAARRRRAQLVLSSGTALIGASMLTGLVGNPMASAEAMGGLAGLLSPTALGAGLLALALAGATAVLSPSRRVARLAAVAQLLGHLLAVSTSHLIMLLGYLLAAAVPLGVLVLAVLACRRYAAARVLVLLGVAAAGTWGWVTGVLSPAVVGETFGHVGAALLAAAAEQLLLAWLVAGTLVAGGVLLAALADHPRRGAWEAWLLRHRVALTLVAAAGPLPYFAVRMTWLTPWPLGAPADLDASIRFWGLLLGSAGLVGTVLTLGLIRPWGSVAPRWIPVVAGRPVPVAAAAVPALVVAVALVVGAVPMAVALLTGFGDGSLAERLLYLLVFPFGIWGPALALATWAYVLHRRGEDVRPVGTSTRTAVPAT